MVCRLAKPLCTKIPSQCDNNVILSETIADSAFIVMDYTTLVTFKSVIIDGPLTDWSSIKSTPPEKCWACIYKWLAQMWSTCFEEWWGAETRTHNGSVLWRAAGSHKHLVQHKPANFIAKCLQSGSSLCLINASILLSDSALAAPINK